MKPETIVAIVFCCLLAGFLTYRFTAEDMNEEHPPVIEASNPEPVQPTDNKTNIADLITMTVLPGTQGTSAKDLGDMFGKAGLMIVFVDTSCPFATQALKELPDVVPILAAADVATVVININDDRKSVTEFYAAKDLGAPVLFDDKPLTQDNWQIASVPTVIVIDAQKKQIYRGVALWEKVLDATTAGLDLAEKLPSPHAGTEFG